MNKNRKINGKKSWNSQKLNKNFVEGKQEKKLNNEAKKIIENKKFFHKNGFEVI